LARALNIFEAKPSAIAGLLTDLVRREFVASAPQLNFRFFESAFRCEEVPLSI